MGNCFSKRSKQEDLEAADSKYVETSKELEQCRADNKQALDQASTFRQQVGELENKLVISEQERQKYVADLRTQLYGKNEEALAQQRVIESGAQERDEARTLLRQREEELESLRVHLEQQRENMEAATATGQEALERARTELSHLKKKLKDLEEEHRTSNEQSEQQKKALEDTIQLTTNELEAARRKTDKATAQSTTYLLMGNNFLKSRDQDIKTLAKAKAEAESELTSAKAGAEQQRLSDQAAMNSLMQQVQALYDELAYTKTQLAESMNTQMPLHGAVLQLPMTAHTGANYLEPHGFSRSTGKDLRITVSEWRGEVAVDIREFYGGAHSKKLECYSDAMELTLRQGVRVPVGDAVELARVLPDVVRAAAAYEQGVRPYHPGLLMTRY